MKTTERPTTLSARDRLLAAADDLFYAEGVHVVGIDRIVERAGVAKASLYSTFGSKDELVRAYLEDHFSDRQRRIAGVLAKYNTARERLIGVFAEIENTLLGSEFRGCRFISAAAEARLGDDRRGAATAVRSAVVALLDAAMPCKRDRRS